MLEWVKAKYGTNSMQPTAIISTLSHVSSHGNYNVYEMSSGEHLVIFSDQSALLKFVNDNLGSVFSLGFLEINDSKYRYSYLFDDHVTRGVTTLARAAVLVLGDSEKPRDLYVDNNNNIVIE